MQRRKGSQFVRQCFPELSSSVTIRIQAISSSNRNLDVNSVKTDF